MSCYVIQKLVVAYELQSTDLPNITLAIRPNEEVSKAIDLLQSCVAYR